MVGSSMACALGKNPLFSNKSILLIEGNPKKNWEFSPKYSNRVSSINISTKRIFEDLGIWKHIEGVRYQVVTDIKVWGENSANHTHFQPTPIGDMAFIVENDVIVNAVTKELENLSNVSRLYGLKINNVHIPEERKMVRLILEDGSNFSGSLLIGADGANSNIRSALGVKYLTWSYNQSAIVATLEIFPDDSTTVAWQKFTPDGTIAILPLTDSLRSLVWSTSTVKANELMSLSDDDFIDLLNDSLIGPCAQDEFVKLTDNAVNSVLNFLKFPIAKGELVPPYMSSIHSGSRASFPLGFGHSTKYIGPRTALIGDAAHRVHPLAGQGVNLGFCDVKNLQDTLAEGVLQGRTLGNFTDLSKYEFRSQTHNLPVMIAIDILQRMYTTEWKPIKAVGNVCFKIAESFPQIKVSIKNYLGVAYFSFT
ncbi:hypothetical protein AAG570_013305 [Ranatra chinensis]|uniref:FAD-binding domain-containing protein n=1 Tax=Ranatra chinensis TaxID=642074 RepID=A0ABD0YGH9_9HEMI